MKKTFTVLISMVMLLGALSVPMLHNALAKPAPADHPEYRDAVNDLRNARKHLEKALADGYGHRDKALQAIDVAIQECDQAVQVLR